RAEDHRPRLGVANDHAWNQQDEAIPADTCGDFRAGLQATSKATICPKIKQIRKLRSRPQDRANADRRRPQRAVESWQSKIGHRAVASRRKARTGGCAPQRARVRSRTEVQEKVKPAGRGWQPGFYQRLPRFRHLRLRLKTRIQNSRPKHPTYIFDE